MEKPIRTCQPVTKKLGLVKQNQAIKIQGSPEVFKRSNPARLINSAVKLSSPEIFKRSNPEGSPVSKSKS